MATLVPYADGNLTGASTFAATETGASALAMVRANNVTMANATTLTSPTFTVTNAKVIDGILLFLYCNGTAGTGTFKVDLQKGGVSQATVTVNKSDLPAPSFATPIPVVFKFTSTATGDGGSNWTIVLTTVAGTGSATVVLSRNSGTTNDWTRALRTTTAATAAASDNLIIVGELTGAGTHNARAVTMDSTAATVYGNGSVNSTTVYGGLVAVGQWGTLTYGTTAATNYLLQVAGDVYVYEGGTLNMGSNGAEIPRDSTAALKMQPVSADNDFGLNILGGVVNIKGLSRTSGKNIVKALLTADVTCASIWTTTSSTNGSVLSVPNALGPEGSIINGAYTDNTTNGNHGYGYGTSGASITGNTVLSGQIVLNRGSGTRNRYVRVQLGNAVAVGSHTTGVYVDVDLQAGTIGTPTAFGTGGSPSASIAAYGTGYVIKISGSISSSTVTTPGIGFLACSAAATTSYAGDTTQCFIYSHVALIVAASIPATTTWNISQDTGWKSGDLVAVASTSQSFTECELFLISADAGVSSFTTVLYPTFTHSGSSPIQAEVILLTRNVKICSTSSSNMAYVYANSRATFNASWAEFYFLGGSASTNNKRGVEFDGEATLANAKTMSYCSIHDGESNTVYIDAGVTTVNANISYCMGWNSGPFALIGQVTNADYTFDNNVNMLAGGYSTGSGFSFTDGLVGTITNNTSVGSGSSTSSGFNISQATISLYNIGTFQNNLTHSGGGPGSLFQATGLNGIIDGLTIWRHNGYGIQFSAGINTASVKFTNLTIFGTASPCIYAYVDALNISTGILCGDTTYTPTYAIYSQYGALQRFEFIDVDMNPGTGIYAAPSIAGFSIASSTQYAQVEGFANNCRFPTTVFGGDVKADWTEDGFFTHQKYNKTAGDHRTDLKYGQIKTDSTIYKTASPSARMTPLSASNKLKSAAKHRGFLVACNSGASASVSVYVRKSAVGDGAAYNGNQIRLMQRANSAMGQNSDVVLATGSASTGTWEQLVGVTSTATDDGAWELYLDCDGTTGWINHDDWLPA